MEYKLVLSVLVLALLAISEAAPPQVKPHLEHPSGKTEGEECDPDDCVLEGDCLDYWWCEREESDHKGKGKKGSWRFDRCDTETNADNRYWNPNKNNGTCDWWDNLDQETKDRYNADENCINPHCEWRVEGECVSNYWYFHPVRTEGKEVELHCPSLADGEQLLWSQARKSCHHCSQVTRNDGSACC